MTVLDLVVESGETGRQNTECLLVREEAARSRGKLVPCGRLTAEPVFLTHLDLTLPLRHKLCIFASVVVALVLFPTMSCLSSGCVQSILQPV